MTERRWRVDRLAHPAVPLLLALDAADDALVFVSLGAHPASLLRHARRHGARLEVERRRVTSARRQLVEYLRGERRQFELSVRLLGTPFQRQAWGALSRIPYGRTASYADQASDLDTPDRAPGSRLARAVGQANAHNPVPIVIPCHRVLGSDGALTGFGGGVATKRWLLEFESSGRIPGWAPQRSRTPPQQLCLPLSRSR